MIHVIIIVHFYFNYAWNPPQKIFSSASLSCHLSACSYCFYSCLVTTEDILLFRHSIVVQEIEKTILLIICTEMLQNYQDGKIVKL